MCARVSEREGCKYTNISSGEMIQSLPYRFIRYLDGVDDSELTVHFRKSLNDVLSIQQMKCVDTTI